MDGVNVSCIVQIRQNLLILAQIIYLSIKIIRDSPVVFLLLIENIFVVFAPIWLPIKRFIFLKNIFVNN